MRHQLLPLSGPYTVVQPPAGWRDDCLCRHARAGHDQFGAQPCDQIGCWCRAYQWERPLLEQVVLASLLVDSREPRCRYYLHALRPDLFCLQPLNAIAASLCRLRERPTRWPPRGYSVWKRLALDLRLNGGRYGRQVADLGWPRALQNGLGTSSGLGFYFSRLLEHTRPQPAQRQRAAVGD